VELLLPWTIIYMSKNTPTIFVRYSFRVIAILSVCYSLFLSTLACSFLPSFINDFKSSVVPHPAFEVTIFQPSFRLHPRVYIIPKSVPASRNCFPFFPPLVLLNKYLRTYSVTLLPTCKIKQHSNSKWLPQLWNIKMIIFCLCL